MNIEQSHTVKARDILSQSVRIVDKTFTLFCLLSILLILPSTIFDLLFLQTSILHINDSSYAYFALISTFLDLFAYVATFIGIVYLTRETMLGQRVSLIDVLKFIYTKYEMVFRTEFIAFLLIIIPGLFLVVPGVIVATYILFAGILSTIRSSKVIDAIKGSYWYVKGRFWEVFRVQLLVGGLVLLQNLVIIWASRTVPGIWVLHKLIPNILVAIISSFPIAAYTILFLDIESKNTSFAPVLE